MAVLISPGYGAGWSTWNPQYPDMMFDPQIADLVINHDGSDLMARVRVMAELKYPDACLSCDRLMVWWVSPGERFMIKEYDGDETLILEKDMAWTTA